jgi:hypothetical protein
MISLLSRSSRQPTTSPACHTAEVEPYATPRECHFRCRFPSYLQPIQRGATKFMVRATLPLPFPTVPSVFGRNLQCGPVRGANAREECRWSHACKSFKLAGVRTNGILECKFLPETRTVRPPMLVVADPVLGSKAPLPCTLPAVCGRDLQSEPVRAVNAREECHWSHAWQRFKRRSKGAKLNGILECKSLSKTGTLCASPLDSTGC